MFNTDGFSFDDMKALITKVSDLARTFIDWLTRFIAAVKDPEGFLEDEA